MAYIDETIHNLNAKDLLNAALISIYCEGKKALMPQILKITHI